MQATQVQTAILWKLDVHRGSLVTQATIEKFFKGVNTEELFTEPQADGSGETFRHPYLPWGRNLLFTPSETQDGWGRIEIYEDEGGGGGESNRRHHLATVKYRHSI